MKQKKIDEILVEDTNVKCIEYINNLQKCFFLFFHNKLVDNYHNIIIFFSLF